MAIKWRLDAGQIEVIDDAVADILRRKTPAQRLAAAFDLNHSARMIIEGSLRHHHPGWDQKAILREVARRMSGGAI